MLPFRTSTPEAHHWKKLPQLISALPERFLRGPLVWTGCLAGQGVAQGDGHDDSCAHLSPEEESKAARNHIILAHTDVVAAVEPFREGAAYGKHVQSRSVRRSCLTLRLDLRTRDSSPDGASEVKPLGFLDLSPPPLPLQACNVLGGTSKNPSRAHVGHRNVRFAAAAQYGAFCASVLPSLKIFEPTRDGTCPWHYMCSRSGSEGLSAQECPSLSRTTSRILSTGTSNPGNHRLNCSAA